MNTSTKTDVNDIPNTEYDPNNNSHRAALATGLTITLERAGFSFIENTTKEEVWMRTLANDPNVRVRVFTSIVSERFRDPKSQTHQIVRSVRNKGQDAIRVCATKIQEGKEIGLVKTHRINRTGKMRSIAQRTLDKMREVYKLANDRRNWNGK